jgi:hypothetical protein
MKQDEIDAWAGRPQIHSVVIASFSCLPSRQSLSGVHLSGIPRKDGRKTYQRRGLDTFKTRTPPFEVALLGLSSSVCELYAFL